MGKLFLLFTTVPLLELYVLLVIGRQLGVLPTVVIVLTTASVGAMLAHREGLRVLREWQVALAEGRVPSEGVISGLLVLVGGAFLVTPGVITDVCGFCLLIPPTRRAIGRFLAKRAERWLQRGGVVVVGGRGGFGAAPPWPPGPTGVIDVDGEAVNPPPSQRPPLRS